MSKSPVRALIVSLGYFRVPDVAGGGVDLHVYNLANALARQGIEVHLVADLTDQAILEPGVNLCRIGAPLFTLKHRTYGHFLFNYFRANIYAARRAIGIFNELKTVGRTPDVVHAHGNLGGLILRRFLGDVPIAYTVHNPTPWMCRYETRAEHLAHVASVRLFEIPMWRACTRAIALSSSIKSEMIRLGVDDERIAVVPNGVDTTFFQHTEDTDNSLNGLKLCLESRDRWCVFVGQLVKRKGVSVLLEALVQVEGLGCFVIGGGPEQEALRELSASLKLGDRVVFTGPLDQKTITALYSSCDVFVMPSTADAFPLVVLEAMACGLPVISTDIGAAREIVFDGFNGFIVPPRQVAELAARLRALSSDTVVARELGANAQRLVREYYTWDRVAQATESVYRNEASDERWVSHEAMAALAGRSLIREVSLSGRAN